MDNIKDKGKNQTTDDSILFFIILIIIFAFAILFYITSFNEENYKKVQFDVYEYYNDNNNLTFNLGSKIVDDEEYILFYIKNKKGNLQLMEFNSKNIEIINNLDKDEHPYIIYNEYYNMLGNRKLGNAKIYIQEERK